jgi:hypothetical protein
MPKKNKELKYESVERVSRWNLCQQIAKFKYASDLSNDDLELELEELESELINKCN